MSSSEVRYKRHLARLEELSKYESFPRIKVSEASQHLIEYTRKTNDPLLENDSDNPFTKRKRKRSRCIMS